MALQLPACCLASAMLQQQLLFRSWLAFKEKRKLLNYGNQKLPKPHCLPFSKILIAEALQRSVRAILPGMQDRQSWGGILHRALQSEQKQTFSDMWEMGFGRFACLYGLLVQMLQQVDCFRSCLGAKDSHESVQYFLRNSPT